MRTRLLLPFLACALAVAGSVRANPMDLTLSRLYQRDTTICDPAHPDKHLCADQAAFADLARELGLAVAPAPIVPAETLGYNGFFLAVEGSLTTINSSDDRNNVWRRVAEDGNPDEVLFVSSIHVRKALPWSFELGINMSYVAATEQVLMGGDLRFAPLEGYRSTWKGAFPDIAIRGSVNRLLGDDEMELTVWSIDIIMDYTFAVGGSMTLTPFWGYQFVQTIADTGMVANGMYWDHDSDPGTPEVSRIQCDAGTGYMDYQTQCTGEPRYLEFDREYIDRHRGFVGLRLLYESFSTIIDFAFTDGQYQFGASLGFDY